MDTEDGSLEAQRRAKAQSRIPFALKMVHASLFRMTALLVMRRSDSDSQSSPLHDNQHFLFKSSTLTAGAIPIRSSIDLDSDDEFHVRFISSFIHYCPE
ncbi:hypothetical protein Ciccas_001100 [Cichlidogyrus casuarinus]|uniref:Uncharacterized protein n=1 Tax=Cichlidogyrus casuarinus TaxID=1844966 RepID=A0ABD2QL23_9PLAT